MTFRPPIIIPVYPRPKAIGEPVGTNNAVLTPNPSRPFRQTDWPSAAPLKPLFKAAGEVTSWIYPLYEPNPKQPFVQSDWPVAPPLKPLFKALGEPTSWIYPLYQPNPKQPFKQADWPSLPRVSISLKSDSYWGPNPVLTPNPAQPFNQNLWEGERPLPKAIGEALGTLNSLLTPNPSRPFNQYDWPPLQFTRRAKDYEFVNLPPPVVVVQAPFYQTDWPSLPRVPKAKDYEFVNLPPSAPFYQTDWTGVAALRSSAKVDDVVNLFALHSIATSQPFSQIDWPKTYNVTYSAFSESFGLNQNFPPPPPPTQTVFFTVSGSEVKDRFPTTSVSYDYTVLYGVPSNASRRTN